MMSKSICTDTNNVYYQRFVKFMDLLLNKYDRKVFNICSVAEKRHIHIKINLVLLLLSYSVVIILYMDIYSVLKAKIQIASICST